MGIPEDVQQLRASAGADKSEKVTINDAIDPRDPSWQAAADASAVSVRKASRKFLLLRLTPAGKLSVVKHGARATGQLETGDPPPRSFANLGMCRAYAKLHGASGDRFLTMEVRADHSPEALAPNIVPSPADLIAFMTDAEFVKRDTEAGQEWYNGFGSVSCSLLEGANWGQIAQALDLA